MKHIKIDDEGWPVAVALSDDHRLGEFSYDYNHDGCIHDHDEGVPLPWNFSYGGLDRGAMYEELLEIVEYLKFLNDNREENQKDD